MTPKITEHPAETMRRDKATKYGVAQSLRRSTVAHILTVPSQRWQPLRSRCGAPTTITIDSLAGWNLCMRCERLTFIDPA